MRRCRFFPRPLYCARDSLLPYSRSIHCFFLSLSFSLPSSIHLFPFLVLFVFISFPAPAPADLAALFLSNPTHTRSRVSSLRRSRFAPSARSCSHVPPFRVPLRSLPLFYPLSAPPPAPPTRLSSERNQSPCTKPNAAQPCERCVNWKAPRDTRISRTFCRRVSRARIRCTELRNPGIHAASGPRRWRIACMSTHDLPPPSPPSSGPGRRSPLFLDDVDARRRRRAHH